MARIHDWADMGLDHASLVAGKFGLATRDNIPDPKFDSGTSRRSNEHDPHCCLVQALLSRLLDLVFVRTLQTDR